MKHSTHESVLPNGIKLLIIDVVGTDDLNIVVAINAGYRRATIENIDQYEAPHLLEHMVFDGSKNYPSHEALHDVFTLSGGSYNGSTSAYHNLFMFDNKVKNAAELFPAIFDMVFRPLLSQASYDEEFRVVENELNEYLGDFGLNAEQYTQQQILPDLPVSTDTQLARLPLLTYEATVSYHQKYYGTNNATVIVLCDTKKLPRAQIEKLILSAAQGVPEMSHYEHPISEFADKHDHATQSVEIGKSIEQSSASIQFVVPGLANEKMIQMLSLFSSIASDMNSHSIIFKLRKMGLVYGMGCETSASIESYGIALSIDAANDKFFEVFSHTLGLTRDLANNGVPESVFEKLKAAYIDQFNDMVETTDGIMGWYLGDYLTVGSLLQPVDYKKLVAPISQEEILGEVRNILSHDNQFASVFTSKEVRVSTGMDTLSKAILVDNKIVSDDLIASSTVTLNVKRFLGKELDSYYKLDKNASLSKRVAYYINSRPILAWTGIVLQLTFGIFLIFAGLTNLLSDELFYTAIGIIVGIACIVEACIDIYMRHRLRES